MMTIVTRVKLREGCEPRWDAAMRERLEAARNQAGWIAGQVDPRRRARRARDHRHVADAR